MRPRVQKDVRSKAVYKFQVKGIVKIFPVINPWIYVSVPQKHTSLTKKYADRGLVSITVTLGQSTWNTSLLPKGDGTQFIPLSAKIRKKENIEVGDRIKLFYILRVR